MCGRGMNVCPWAHGERGRTIAPGGAIVRLPSVFSILERVSVNNHPRGANVGFLSKFDTLEETFANDRPMVGEHSLPQCATFHFE
jgi:hypothetical protein